MAEPIYNSDGTISGYKLSHTGQEVDDGLEAVNTKAAQTALEAETAARQAADTALENRIDAAYIVETAEGAVAHFEDGADVVPLKSCVVHIEPVQTGSGDPSPDNVRPITGRTGMTVMRCGKNLYSTLIGADDFTDNVHATHANDGGVMVIKMSSEDNSGVYSRGVSAIKKLLVGKTSPITYSFDIKSTVEGDVAVGYQSAGRLVKNVGTDWQHVSITATPNGNSNAFVVYNHSGVAREVQIKNFQFELGSTATDYELYTGKTYNITFPDEAGAVYGGTLDVVSGVLTVDRVKIQLNGSMDWNKHDKGAWVRIPAAIDAGNATAQKEILVACDTLQPTSWVGISALTLGVSMYYGHGIILKNAELSTLDAYKSWINQLQPNVVYKLAAPITYQLTPQEIASLLGTNNIWADCGNVSVEYRADPTLAHESGGGSGGQGDKGDKGDPGNDGYTPVKGVDYWTAADKQEMVQDVLAALPTWTGGSY